MILQTASTQAQYYISSEQFDESSFLAYDDEQALAIVQDAVHELLCGLGLRCWLQLVHRSHRHPSRKQSALLLVHLQWHVRLFLIIGESSLRCTAISF